MKNSDESENNKYIIFKMDDSFYGTPLLDVREVVEYVEPKIIPNMRDYFKGIINLRGEIIGVIDLKNRFSLKSSKNQVNRSSLMIFSTEQGALAASVDQVVSVVSLSPDQIELHPNISTNVKLEYLLGIGKIKHEMITLISLQKLLSQEELKEFKNTKLVA